ncbi:sugar ABC transporter substrate-binding protein [Nocardioides sp. WS12]|uniref:sugar ABC transporter substrate-binding protein n=1 Tax=Nocardioides sp. WS12 TaxID=2486272 RepID=UPI0015FAC258|nr:sugar ABC transporter substrate-binding protein [Nocardioides sp. WS12]
MNRHLGRAALALCSIVALAACSTGTTGDSSGSRPDVVDATIDKSGDLAGKRVLYVDAVPGNAILDGIAQGLANELNAEGAEMVRVFQINAQNTLDLAAGAQRVNEGIAQDVDAIIAFPLDVNAFRPGVKAANEAGIPIFIFQDLAGLDVTGKVAFPDQARGKETGLALAEVAGGEGTATVLSGVPTDNIEKAVAGAIDGLEEGGMKIVGDPNNQRNLKDDAPEAQRIAQAIFQKYPDLSALLVYNSASATGAIAAAKQAGLEGKVKIGNMSGEDVNISQVKDGKLAVNFDFDGPAYGKVMSELVIRALSGEKLDNEVVDAPLADVYNEDNAADYVPWTERLTYVKIPSSY